MIAALTLVRSCCCTQKLLKTKLYFLRYKKFRRPDTPLPAFPSLTLQALNAKKPYFEVESYPNEFDPQLPKGRIYDNKAFPINLEVNKKYKWCTCGISKSQPLCDGSHFRLDGTEFVKKRPLFRPLEFTVAESKTYHLCNCKQTDNRPFCDGTHRRKDIQEAIKS